MYELSVKTMNKTLDRHSVAHKSCLRMLMLSVLLRYLSIEILDGKSTRNLLNCGPGSLSAQPFMQHAGTEESAEINRPL